MKVTSPNFSLLFRTKAARFVAGEPTVEPKAEQPQDTFLGQFKRLVGFKPTPPASKAQTTLGLRAAYSALGAPTAMALAQEVGLETQSGQDLAGARFKQKKAAQLDTSAPPNQKMDAVWSDIVSLTGTAVERPTLLNDPGRGVGSFVGESLFADSEAFMELPRPLALFYTAHELGHVENRDGARKKGMSQLAGLLTGVAQPALRAARQANDWELEHKADARAAEICAQLGCQPESILEDLMKEPSGSQHPPGVERAKRVRSIMAEHGQTISDGKWDSLLEETAPIRGERQQAIDELMNQKHVFENLP